MIEEISMTHYIKGFPQSEADEDLKFVNVDELEEKAKEVMPEGLTTT